MQPRRNQHNTYGADLHVLLNEVGVQIKQDVQCFLCSCELILTDLHNDTLPGGLYTYSKTLEHDEIMALFMQVLDRAIQQELDKAKAI